MKYCVILLFTIFLTWTSKAQDVLTVDDVIRIGLRNNFNILIAKNTETITQRGVGKGTAGYLPTVNLVNNAQFTQTNQTTNSPFAFGSSNTRSFGTQVALNWTLFDGFKMFKEKNRLEALSTLGSFQTRDTVEQTVVNIVTTYFDLVQQEQLLRVVQNALNVSETRLNQEQIRNDLGGASSTDLFNAQVSYNNDKASVLNQELQVVIARKNLNMLLARDPDTSISVSERIEVQPLEQSYQNLIQAAVERNSGLQVARQNTRVAKENVELSKGTFYPVLALISNYGYTDRRVSAPNFGAPITTQSRDGVIGMTLSYNLFNGTRDRIDLHNAEAEAYNQELTLRRSELELRGLVLEKYETFQRRMDLVALEIQNVEAAERNLQLQQERYRLGSTTSLEFRDAQVNLIRAQATLINARFQARITRLEIEQLIGNIDTSG